MVLNVFKGKKLKQVKPCSWRKISKVLRSPKKLVALQTCQVWVQWIV